MAAVMIVLALSMDACGRRTDSTSTSPPSVDSGSIAAVTPDTMPGSGADTSAHGALRAPVPHDSTAGGPSRGTPVNPAEMIHVVSPRPGQVVTSPLEVTGEARGPWYFEATFPVRLVDDAGHDLAIGPAHAEGEWMTSRFVPFKVTLTFNAPKGRSGTLVLERSNPSGDVRRASEVRVPVTFR